MTSENMSGLERWYRDMLDRKQNAFDKGICVHCGTEVLDYVSGDVPWFRPEMIRDETEEKEYWISGFCGPCFDNVTREEE